MEGRDTHVGRETSSRARGSFGRDHPPSWSQRKERIATERKRSPPPRRGERKRGREGWNIRTKEEGGEGEEEVVHGRREDEGRAERGARATPRGL